MTAELQELLESTPTAGNSREATLNAITEVEIKTINIINSRIRTARSHRRTMIYLHPEDFLMYDERAEPCVIALFYKSLGYTIGNFNPRFCVDEMSISWL